MVWVRFELEMVLVSDKLGIVFVWDKLGPFVNWVFCKGVLGLELSVE